MLTVPEAARRAGRNPETIRRWIRSGKLQARKIGTQHVIEEEDLDAVLDEDAEQLPVPESWKYLPDGQPMPNVVAMIRRSRQGH
jgi:excisionase family DNA binding protein